MIPGNRQMSKAFLSRLRRNVAVAGFAAAVSTSGCIVEAYALDDGEAPIWTGIGDIVGPWVGLSHDDKNPIEYRERSKLVIPPKMELPKPGGAKANPAWPADQEAQRAKKLKEFEDGPSTLPLGRKTAPIVAPGAVVTMSASAGVGPTGAGCLKDGVLVACPDEPKKHGQPGAPLNWNPLTWVGIQKKPDTVLGPEPDRDFLTDPPQGYRAPVEGVGAKIQSN